MNFILNLIKDAFRASTRVELRLLLENSDASSVSGLSTLPPDTLRTLKILEDDGNLGGMRAEHFNALSLYAQEGIKKISVWFDDGTCYFDSRDLFGNFTKIFKLETAIIYDVLVYNHNHIFIVSSEKNNNGINNTFVNKDSTRVISIRNGIIGMHG